MLWRLSETDELTEAREEVLGGGDCRLGLGIEDASSPAGCKTPGLIGSRLDFLGGCWGMVNIG